MIACLAWRFWICALKMRWTDRRRDRMVALSRTSTWTDAGGSIVITALARTGGTGSARGNVGP